MNMYCGNAINFSFVLKKAQNMSARIKRKKHKLIKALLNYESYEVALDEISRTLDLLENISENSEYFIRKICSVFCFIPRNQPLYAFFCFAIVPSFLSEKVIVKRSSSMGEFFDDLLNILEISTEFPNLEIFNGKREEFLKIIHDARCFQESCCFGSAIIFTGTGKNANIVKSRIGKKMLFIGNGSAHNPIIISENANVKSAVKSVLRAKLYNSGQDCSSPNSILVHSKIYRRFLSYIKAELKNVNVGCYLNRKNRVGSLSDKSSIHRINNILTCNKIWVDKNYSGIFSKKNCVLKPTIIKKPLERGGNYIESFAPIFFIQKYNFDQDLKLYFENVNYIDNAGYISVFGKSEYIKKEIIGKDFMKNKRIIHPIQTIIRNTDLHEPGIERGVKSYGGYGKEASFVAYNGKVISKPTLPQRDIFEILVKPKL
ncbi:alpha-ketoglutaric semialdehyde dehydrogenase [bacterium BMS3Abin15]|nr:alpha-ketoglutaric semialdehyde dehydrogenase [bacterium BMS3Abin15]